MNAKITTRNTELTEELKARINTKLIKLNELNTNITQCELILSEEHHHFIADLILHVDRKDIVLKEESEHMKKSIERLFDRAFRQLRKHKNITHHFEHEKMSSHI